MPKSEVSACNNNQGNIQQYVFVKADEEFIAGNHGKNIVDGRSSGEHLVKQRPPALGQKGVKPKKLVDKRNLYFCENEI